ncbi:MAG: 50S ribosomal protein L23 [bacterium]|nr:50S ribosomal protein L23 [bacterium]
MHILIKRPIVTEKAVSISKAGTYTFEVDKKADKIEIAKAVEKDYGVHVVSVKTAIMHGKTKRVGKRRTQLKQSDWKKAFVKLVEGEKIEAYGN